MEKTKKCEICGEVKPITDFSKSYKHRCKACVAEMTRNSRHINGHHAATLIIDELKIDIAAVEMRLVEVAIGALIKKNDGHIMNYECIEIGRQAVEIAHAALSRMKFCKRNEDNL